MTYYNNEYIDYTDPTTNKKYRLKHKMDLYGVPDDSWQLSGLNAKMDPLDYGGRVTKASILIGIQGSGVFVEENKYNHPSTQNYLNDVLIKNVGNDILEASKLLDEANTAANLNKFGEAKDLAQKSKIIFSQLKNEKGINLIDDFFKKIDLDLSRKKEKIIKNKKRIHKIIYEKNLVRCLLFGEDPNSQCNKLAEINSTINNFKIFGFFMYKFPDKADFLKNENQNKENKNFLEEVEEFLKLIKDVNNNPLIKIDFPKTATDLGVKTCDFCRIARSYDFGILLLSPPNPNAFLEAGMFLALGKKIILLNNESTHPTAPFDLSPFFYIHYKNIDEIKDQWNRKIPDFIKNLITTYTTELIEFKFKIHKIPNIKEHFYLEIISKSNIISPFCIAVDIAEKSKVIEYAYGPSNIIPIGSQFQMLIEREFNLKDGTKIFLWQSDNELNSYHSYYLRLINLPSKILLGHPNSCVWISLNAINENMITD